MRKTVSPFFGWIGLLIAAVIAGLSAGLGFWQGLPAQTVILYTVATFALIVWLWQYIIALRSKGGSSDSQPEVQEEEAQRAGTAFRRFLSRNKGLLIALLVLLLGFLIASVTVKGFFT